MSVPARYLLLFFHIIFLMLCGCTSSPRYRSGPGERAPGGYYQVGVASYYGREFHGRKTSNGELYDMNAMTAAHPNLPFETLIEVTNLANGRKIVVRINDRGPWVEGRIIDLSYAAAKRLDVIDSGTAKVGVKIMRIGGER